MEQVCIAGALLPTLRGTPTMYYGDEIGMTDVDIPRDRIQDPWELREPGLGLGRDPERTPMQWDSTPSAGFTGGRAWLPLSQHYRTSNVAYMKADSGSLLNLYRDL